MLLVLNGLRPHRAYGAHVHAKSTVDWQFTERHARSVVLHNDHTHTKPGEAGTTGPRLVCVNVEF